MKTACKVFHVDLTEDDDIKTDQFLVRIPTVKREISVDHDDDADFSSDQESSDESKENGDFPADDDLPSLAYYRGDKKLPIYSYTSPDLKRIFRICLKKDILANRITEIKPTSISSTSTFVVDQKLVKVKHPFNIEADETLGAYEKKEQTRFYEVKVGKDGELLISSEVSVEKDAKGNIVGGTFNTRDSRNWVRQVASSKHLYAVIRKRAVHKKTMQKFNTAFTRYVIFIMPIVEYNEVYGHLKNM